jgi:SAM-dependent methyltransferase
MTDLTALALHRDRATDHALFLHRAALEEVQDRLELVNKFFTDPVLVTAFPAIWADALPDAIQVAADDTLALDPGAHDLAVHALALHWSNDPIGQLIQCRRALRPDGLFLGVSFGGRTLHELRACLAQAESEVTGGLSPRVAPMAELRDMGALLQRAGFALPVADAQTLTVEYADAWSLMRDLRAMGENNALHARLRRPTARSVLERAAQLYRASFATPKGRITATFELIFLTGWAPSGNQPKPLRPGSAQQRLADALKTDETKLPI